MYKLVSKISCLLILVILLSSASKMTLDDIRNELNKLPENSCESFQCDIEILYNGQSIGMSKMYKEGNKQRVEIETVNMEGMKEDMIIVSDSHNTYTKTNEGWIKGEGTMINSVDYSDMGPTWIDVLEKKDVKLESLENRKAILQFKETENVMGVGNGRIGIDLDTGNIVFYELQTPMGHSSMIFEYESRRGYSYAKTIKINTQTNEISGFTEINIKNVKVNERMNQNLFKIDDSQIVK